MVTPQDIRNKEFEIKLRGYDKEEVDVFLDSVYGEMRRLTEENRRITEEKEALEASIARYRDMEDVMRRTIDTARETARQTIQSANAEAELIKKKAENEVRAEIMRIDEEHSLKLTQIKAMQNRLDDLAARVRAECQNFTDSINRIKK